MSLAFPLARPGHVWEFWITQRTSLGPDSLTLRDPWNDRLAPRLHCLGELLALYKARNMACSASGFACLLLWHEYHYSVTYLDSSDLGTLIIALLLLVLRLLDMISSNLSGFSKTEHKLRFIIIDINLVRGSLGGEY